MRHDTINVPNVEKLAELVLGLKMNGVPFTVEMCDDGSSIIYIDHI